MELVPSDKERGLQTPIWNLYESLLLTAGCKVSAALRMGPSVSWRLGKSQSWGYRCQRCYLSLWPPPFEHPPSPLKPLLLPPPPRILTCLLGSWSHLSQRIVGCLVGPPLDVNGCAPSPQILLFATSFLLRSAYHTAYIPTWQRTHPFS